MDIAAMLFHREWYAAQRPTYRYVGIDASPQRAGLEVFATLERVVLRADVSQMLPGQSFPSSVQVRRLPLAVLGQGHGSMACLKKLHEGYTGEVLAARSALRQQRALFAVPREGHQL